MIEMTIVQVKLQTKKKKTKEDRYSFVSRIRNVLHNF